MRCKAERCDCYKGVSQRLRRCTQYVAVRKRLVMSLKSDSDIVASGVDTIPDQDGRNNFRLQELTQYLTEMGDS